MYRKMIRITVILSLPFLLFVGGCARGEKPPTPEQAAETIKVGVVGPMTGSAADMGLPFFQGVKLAADEINKAGGIAGKQIELIQVDDQADPSKSVTAVKKLIFEDKVVAILGPNNSGCALAVKEIANDNKTPMLMNGFVKAILSENLPYVFRLCAEDEANFEFVYQLAKKYKRVGIIHDTAGFGQNVSEIFVQKMARDGLKPVARESYPMGAVDVTPQVLRLKNANVDFVVWAGAAADAATVAKAMQRLGLKVPMAGNNGIFPSALRIAGNLLDGYVYADSMDYNNPRCKAFIDKFMKTYNVDWNYASQHEPCEGYDGMYLLAEGLKKSNGQGGEALLRALESGVSILGVCGKVDRGMSVSKEKHNALLLEDLTWHEIKNGQYAMMD